MGKKMVRDTAAGQSISAYIVLDKKGKHVSTIQAHYSNGGVVTVDVWNVGEGVQSGSAGGYGYDKFAAALRGLTVAGVMMHDHCGHSNLSEKLLKQYKKGRPSESGVFEYDRKWEAKVEKLGMHFANWSTVTGGWGSLFHKAGLDAMSKMGFRVIQAI